MITEDLSYQKSVKFSLTMEHSGKKVKELGKNQGEEEDRVAAL